tara:strand:+ start:11609 stop:11968 length:360 start_codon:yes stop_codon:yes gene_type:complete
MEAHTAEDIIWMLCAVAMVGGALFIGRRFRDSLGMKILRILVYPLIMIGKILDGNWWADKIGEKSGAYEKARNNPVAKWSRELAGWKWWVYQIGVGGIGLIAIELVLNLVGLSLLPWRW